MYGVLVPVDDDENRARNQAAYVAGLGAGEDVEATVLRVVPPTRRGETVDETFADADAAVAAADHLAASGVEVDRRTENGGVAEQVVRTAAELESHEIVMGGRRRSGVARVLLGSTVQDVFRSTERPVTITGTGMVFGERRRLLLPVDGSRERARHQAEYVTNLPVDASELKATVLHVFPHQDYEGAPPHEFEDVGAAVEAADRLETAGVTVERVAVGGEVERTVLEAAAERDADGIVVGGRKRSGVQKVILGSTAQDVMLSAERPVTLTG